MGFPSVGNSLMKKCPHALLRAFGSLNSFTAMVAYVPAFLTSFVIAYLFFYFLSANNASAPIVAFQI
jgi:hypothetical protein